MLAGSGAYALSEAMGWKEGLERRVADARGFDSIIAVSVLVALALQYSPIRPMRALFWSAVINGMVAVPLMVVVIVLVSKPTVMGPFTASQPVLALGWTASAVMGARGPHNVYSALANAVFGAVAGRCASLKRLDGAALARR